MQAAVTHISLKVIILHKPLIPPEIYSIPLHNAQKLLLLESSVGSSWLLDNTETSPKLLLSSNRDTYLTMQVPLLDHTQWSSLLIPTKIQQWHPGTNNVFFFFFLDTLSVFVLQASKPRRTCNQGPMRVPQRRGSGEPNTDWAQTLNITLLPLRAVSFIL